MINRRVFKPQGKQLIALKFLLDKITETVAFGGGGGGAKSYLGVFWLWLMCNTYEGVRYFIGRNELKRLKETTLVSYFEFLNDYDIPEIQRGKYNSQQSTITFDNSSVITLLDLKFQPSDPLGQKFGSSLFTGGFIDESAEVDFRYIDVLYSRIGRWKNSEYNISPKILETFNPDKNHVYTRFYKPYKEGVLAEKVEFIKTTVVDRLKHPEYFKQNEKLHKDDEGTGAGIYAKSLLKRSETLKQRLLWGNFDYDDDPNTLIDYKKSLEVFENDHIEQFSDGDRFLTCDIAGRGSDKAVFMVWDYFTVIHCESHDITTGKDTVEIMSRLQNEYLILEKNITFDADGIGGGITGYFKKAFEFKNGSKALYEQNYQNLKTQCYFILSDFINNNWLYFKSELSQDEKQSIIEELGQVKEFNADKDAKLRILPKETVKANIGRSPDFSDTLAMRMVFELRDAHRARVRRIGYRRYWIDYEYAV